MEPESIVALAALATGLSGAAAAYAYVKNTARKLDAARAKLMSSRKTQGQSSVVSRSEAARLHFAQAVAKAQAQAQKPTAQGYGIKVKPRQAD